MHSRQRHIRRHGPVHLVSERPALPNPTIEPMAALARQSVEGLEGHDPSGILQIADDGAGGLSMGLSASAGATPGLAEGVGWSMPMRNGLGRRIPAIATWLPGGWVRLAVAKPPASHFAGPSHMQVFAGFTSDGPIGTATKGLAFGLVNVTAGAWRAYLWTLQGGVWTPFAANNDTPANKGCHGSWGANYLGGSGTAYGMSVITTENTAGAYSRWLSSTLPLAGNDPHFVFGAGWADTPPGDDTVAIQAFGMFGDDPADLLP